MGRGRSWTFRDFPAIIISGDVSFDRVSYQFDARGG